MAGAPSISAPGPARSGQCERIGSERARRAIPGQLAQIGPVGAAARPSRFAAVRFLVIQHIACEPPAAYEDVLIERGIAFTRVEIDEGDPLPDWRGLDAIVAMGGPMGAGDDAALPWLTEEKRLIGDAVRAGTPYWGVCLGAQLLAASLGARVHRGDGPEVGVYADVALTEAAREDPVFSAAPPLITTLQWHDDTFDLPDGATLLAGSDAFPHQAFVHGRAYGLQFHLEVGPELAATWADVPAYADALEAVLGPGGLHRLTGDLAANPGMAGLARELFARWIDAVVLAP
jgi:GMP synthase (glutamine-hydrolysing)